MDSMTSFRGTGDIRLGQKVVDSADNQVGIIAKIEGDRAFVDPDPSGIRTIGAKIGLGYRDENTDELHEEWIDTVIDNRVRISAEGVHELEDW